MAQENDKNSNKQNKQDKQDKQSGNQNKGSQGGKSSGTSNRGFASMDPKQQREIASEGGRAAHEKGTAHEFDSEEAAEAGRKGGQASAGNKGRSNKPVEQR